MGSSLQRWIDIEALKAREWYYVFVDCDVPCPENCRGLHVAEYLAETGFRGRVLIRRANAVGAARMHETLLRAGIVVAVAEFGSFLLNEEPATVFDLGDFDGNM